jgi:APA family basic amino acid/polyamine antiporter
MSATAPVATRVAGMKNRALLRLLGVSFGVAVTLGSTVGVGILRTPGVVAAQLGDVWLVMAAWTLGGLYAICGTLIVSELATTLPQAGGWYVYARRALGEYAGFTVGWINWFSFCAAAASISLAIGEYARSLAPALSANATLVATGVILVFTLMHWTGLRFGSRVQESIAFAAALGFAALIVACFVVDVPPAIGLEESQPPGRAAATLVGLAIAFQSVIFTYDGWYGAIYFSEENTSPRNLPRSMIGAVLLIVAIYLLINIGLLRVLPFSRLAASELAVADAARLMFGDPGGRIVTALSIMSLLSVMNATFMQTPRIMYAMSRDGLFFSAATAVNRRGTPTTALLVFAATAVCLASTGAFERLLAITALFFVIMYTSGFVSLLVLRRRETTWPVLPHPFRTWGYPWTVVLMMVLSCVFVAGVFVSDKMNSVYALAVLAASYPLYGLVKRMV